MSTQKSYCVIGQPIAHSRSPRLHNGWFKKYKISAHYDKIEVSPKALGSFMKLFAEKYAGANVTIPHKEKILQYLDGISTEAKIIGAINTIVNHEGKLWGHNTDMFGALAALKEVGLTSLKNKKVLVMGAGGAARAIVYGLSTQGAIVVIANRTLSKAKKLAKEFGAEWCGYDLVGVFPMDIIINASSVGLNDTQATNIFYFKSTIEDWDRKPVVMDIIYTPKYTKLLRDARAAGCKIITGDKMFVAQAQEAFKLFTGIRPHA